MCPCFFGGDINSLRYGSFLDAKFAAMRAGREQSRCSLRTLKSSWRLQSSRCCRRRVVATRVVVGVWVWGLLEVGIEVLLLGA